MAWWGVLGLLLVMGCLGRSPEPRYFTLGGQAAAVTAEGRPLSILLASARLPDYLDRQEMVRRLDSGELEIDSRHRWAGGLQTNVLRALGEALGRELGTPLVVVYPREPRVPPDLRIDVDFDELVVVEAPSLVVRARWAIASQGEEKVHGGTAAFESSVSAGSPRSRVAAHQSALEQLAAAIAADVPR